ncbi:hypothetical protein LSCM1_02298 [Leishmania martiniquensis]|uniref:Uncharacterized protein n=1 Tax=Leishmania martiniquensis TaxID=1580590 RepID=A0A836GQW6_9TRYP|nr:hypothetical protein LSCM1_02298 [Leishmania martiniquensis]
MSLVLRRLTATPSAVKRSLQHTREYPHPATHTHTGPTGGKLFVTLPWVSLNSRLPPTRPHFLFSMNLDDGPDEGSIAEPLPQEQLTMLLSVQDFQRKVAQDPVNLCCVIVTSTLCRHCGIRRILYPRVPGLNAKSSENEDGESEDEDGEDTYGDEDGSQADSGAGSSALAGHFYRDIVQHLVRNRDTAPQRRNVRFFHVCACMEEETCIDFFIAEDPAYSLLNKQPTTQEVALLHKKAHQQLTELLNLLEVHSTPTMRFFLAGQSLRYTAMPSGCSGAAALTNVTAETDTLQATGANWIKWSQVLQNAVVVRNEVMREYDTEEREKARAARAEARRQARLQRKKQAIADEDEEDD